MTTILKEHAISAYGNAYRLAKALGINPSAVYQWEDGKPIPEDKALRLRYVLMPEFFKPNPAIKEG